MKTIIAGSRDLTDASLIDDAVHRAIRAGLPFIVEVVCGMAPGVDLLGKAWAEQNGIPVKEFPADWDQHGKAAGPIRNAQMAAYADALIAIRNNGVSKGTDNMIAVAKRKGLRVFVFQDARKNN